MEFEFQVSGKLFFVTEDDPSETSVDKTVLVSRTWSQTDKGGGMYVLILLTRGISKPNFTDGVANGQNIAPLAPST
jgi:hypothetical protein